jgi:hypothetical protein
MLRRLLLGVAALTSFAIATPATELVTYAVEVRLHSKRSSIESQGKPVLEGLERRSIYEKKGSWFLLVNATPWNMTLTKTSSYQMNIWKFPKTIKPGERAS